MTRDVKNSNNFINILRGLAIFLMLWGHCVQICIPGELDFFENSVFKTIYSFHMPLFMLISGYLFYFSCEKRGLKELLQNRCHGLLQTIILGGIFNFFATTVIYSIVKGNFSIIFDGKWLGSLAGLWFLWSVLSSSIILGIIYKKVKPIWLQIILLILASSLVLLFPNGVNNFFMYPYYVIGFYFAKCKPNIKNAVLNTKYISLVLFPILLLFFEKRHYIYTTGLYSKDYSLIQLLEINVFRYTIGLIGSICAITLMELIYLHVVNKCPNLFVWNWICTMGRKSLQIYTLSVVFLSSYLSVVYPKIIAIAPAIDVFFENNIWIYNLVFTPTLGIVFSVGIIAIIQIFQKIKLSNLIFGK